MKTFWAKSNPYQTVQQHTDELLKRLKKLKEIYPDLKINWDILLYACLYHDIGKINKKFQAKLINDKSIDKTNEIPHGLLSICCLDLDELEEKFSENEIRMLIHSIAYHHERNFFKIKEIIEENMSDEIKELNIQLKDFLYDKVKVTEANDVDEYFNNDRIYPPKEIKTEKDKEKLEIFNYYVMIKGLLNKLDYAASAGIEVEIENNFLEEKLDNMMKKWQEKNPSSCWNELQDFAIKRRNKNIIAVAQTGMGKTEAGLLWIGNNKGFFILPLKTAINAIYERIVKEIVNDEEVTEKIGLLHSETMEKYVELTKLHEEYEELDIDTYSTKTRQLSLPLTVCTLDQLFDFVYSYKGFELKQATLSYSKIVLDEIQMYSPDLLAYVIRGLGRITKMGGKFTILTATLPEIVVDLLREEGVDFELSENFTKENLSVRHSIKVEERLIDTDLIISKYNKNKILVICNTVKEAQRVADELREKTTENEINVFHSKFIRKDRNKKEKEILKLGNKNNKNYGIWITTQVVEASLDIDFDILFTELSDLNGLLQRMGRCYRNRPWNKSDEEYNCYVFIGKENEKNTGIGTDLNGVVDSKIYELSKNLVKKEFGGKITEEEKMKYVSELYTTEKLRDTVYYKRVKDTLNYLTLLETYEKNKEDVKKEFRNIKSITIIPKCVYEKNREDIDNDVIFLKEYKKDLTAAEKVKYQKERLQAKMRITEFTMTIQGYEIKKSAGNNLIKESSIEIGKNQIIYVLDCIYDEKNGFKIKKDSTAGKIVEDEFII